MPQYRAPRTSLTKTDAQRAAEMRRRKRRLHEFQEHELATWLENGFWRAAAAKKAMIFAQMAGSAPAWRQYWCEAVKWVNTHAEETVIEGDMAGPHGWRGYINGTEPQFWNDTAVHRGVVLDSYMPPQLRVTAEQVQIWLEKSEANSIEVRPGVWR